MNNETKCNESKSYETKCHETKSYETKCHEPQSAQNRIHVAAAVIFGADGRILLAQRPAEVHQGGLWEFPGGKLQQGETVEQALTRELYEELDINVELCQPLMQQSHDYSDKKVLLDFWKVTKFSGQPIGKEGQPIQWVAVSELKSFSFPKANQAVVEVLQKT